MERPRERTESRPSTWAEWLLDLGKQVNRQICRGAGIEEVSRGLQSTADACILSLVFYRSSDVLKIRALIEDWSRDRLVLELGGNCRAEQATQKAVSR